MDQWVRGLERVAGGGEIPTIETTVLSLLLAFVLGKVVAWVYCWTHSGVSYSRSFAQSLVMITLVVTLVMIVIGNNIVTAFGLIGALAIIRFRNVLKDTRDTVYIFAALVLGMAIGSERFATAIVGMAAVLGTALYLDFTAFGSRGRFDGYLRYRIPADFAGEQDLWRVMRAFCLSVKQVSVRRAGGDPMSDCTYQVRMRDRERGQTLVSELERIPLVQDVTLVLQEEIAEI